MSGKDSMPRKRLARDRRGLEGLPLHLMVGMAALLLTIPPALASFGAIQEVMDRDRIERELERLMVCSKQVALGAPGGVRFVELDLDHSSLQRVRIGGSPLSKADAMTVAYSLRGG
ncbi:MAG: hypothetical protein QCI38_04175, partial [Candidatus Thermoplasmatota archaeon]|nr:hypothetical protein [Candidatus Thermoplasmatota archaeon]